jgi:hypothetical protein
MWDDFTNFNVMTISRCEHVNILVIAFHGVNMVMFPKLLKVKEVESTLSPLEIVITSIIFLQFFVGNAWTSHL